MAKCASFLRRLTFFGLVSIAALAPMPFGSNRDWSWSPLAAVVGVLILTQALSRMLSKNGGFASFRGLRMPALLVTAVVAWGLAQAFGWTPPSWENPIRLASLPYLLPSTNHSVALDREQALIGLMRLLTYVSVFILAADLSADPRNARQLIGGVVCSAVFYTLYSTMADVANRMTVATGFTVPTPVDSVFSGPFINRNNYATYAAVAALAALALAIGKIRVGVPSVAVEIAAERWRRRLGALSGGGGLWLLAAAILIMGALLSGSRAGWASLAIGLLFMVALPASGLSRWTVGAATLLGLAALVLLLPAGGMLLRRAATLIEYGDQGREYLFSLTTDAISLRPLLGWGMNSFQGLFSVFQPAALSATFDKAHNTYFELAFDLGVPAAAALVVAVVWVAVRCLLGILERRRDRELTALGFCASITVGVHALFDFSLQIPAISIVFATLLGAAWAQSWSSRRLAVSARFSTA